MSLDFFAELMQTQEVLKRLEQLRTRVAELEASVAAMRNSHNRLNGKVTRLQKEVWGNSNRWSLTEEPNE